MGRASRLKKERAEARKNLPVRFAKAACVVLPQYFRPDCCINGTAVALEVFRRHGIEATPISTRALVFNPKAWELVEASGMRLPETEDETRQWLAAGAWMLQIDEHGVNGKPGYKGHVVCVAGNYLVDASSGQFTRLARNIVTPFSWALPAPSDVSPARFLVGDASWTFGSDDGVIVLYQARPDDREYQFASGWMNPINIEVADVVCEEMKRGAL